MRPFSAVGDGHLLTGAGLFSPHPVPFALTPKRLDDGTIQIFEDGAASTRVYRRALCYFFLGAPPLFVIGSMVLIGPWRTPPAPLAVIKFAIGWLSVFALLFWLLRRLQTPSREIRFDPEQASIQLTLTLPPGAGACPATAHYPLAAWSITTHSVQLHRSTKRWHGFAAIANLGLHRVPLVCSTRMIRVQDYIAALPLALRQTTTVSNDVLSSEAIIGGDLRG